MLYREKHLSIYQGIHKVKLTHSGVMLPGALMQLCIIKSEIDAYFIAY